MAAFFSTAATAANNCTFVTKNNVITLQADCSTDASLAATDGMTLNLGGHTVTAHDPAGDHFRGGVVQQYGGTANVTNGTITTSGLAEVCDGGADRLRGVLFDGASGSITNLQVLNINQNQGPVLSGCQEGNAIEARNFGGSPSTINVTIDGNTISGYQKTGIVVNGDAAGVVTNNTITGDGPQAFIAQNGIQIGFGATAQVKRNTVTGNSYTGNTGDASGGVLVVAGPFYGSGYSVSDQIDGNTLIGNDIGVWLSQIDAFGNPPATPTSAKVTNNTISNSAVTNGIPYQAGVLDQGNNDKIVGNSISGAGYDPANPCGCTFAVDVTATNRPKVHSNK
jgi:parallel beta-helix repeat protein